MPIHGGKFAGFQDFMIMPELLMQSWTSGPEATADWAGTARVAAAAKNRVRKI
jgi:hypothetical protein